MADSPNPYRAVDGQFERMCAIAERVLPTVITAFPDLDHDEACERAFAYATSFISVGSDRARRHMILTRRRRTA